MNTCTCACGCCTVCVGVCLCVLPLSVQIVLGSLSMKYTWWPMCECMGVSHNRPYQHLGACTYRIGCMVEEIHLTSSLHLFHFFLHTHSHAPSLPTCTHLSVWSLSCWMRYGRWLAVSTSCLSVWLCWTCSSPLHTSVLFHPTMVSYRHTHSDVCIKRIKKKSAFVTYVDVEQYYYSHLPNAYRLHLNTCQHKKVSF